jgi:hypothetical protein
MFKKHEGDMGLCTGNMVVVNVVSEYDFKVVYPLLL